MSGRFLDHAPAIAAAMDEPVADYAILPDLETGAVSKSFKVILSGEGGDEMFGGYGRYRSLMRSVWLGGRGMRRRGTMEGLNLLTKEDPDGAMDCCQRGACSNFRKVAIRPPK